MAFNRDITETLWFKRLTNLNMEVLEINIGGDSKKIKCRCKKCNHVAVYDNKSDLARMPVPCEMCKVLDSLRDTTEIIYKKYEKKSGYLPKRCVPYRDANTGQLTAHVECVCAKCGHIEILSISEYKKLKTVNKCSVCKNTGKISKIDPTKNLKSTRKVNDDSTQKVNGPGWKRMYNDLKGREERYVDISDDKVGNKYGNMEIVGMLSADVALCRCLDCAKTGDYTLASIKTGRKNCELCKDTQVRQFNEIPENEMIDFRGKIFNGIEIKKWYKKDGRYKCVAKCCTCKEETEQDLYLVINNKYLCNNCIDLERLNKNSKNSKLSFWCPHCNEMIHGAIPYREYYTKDEILCPECKKKVRIVEDRAFRDSQMEFRNKINPYVNKGLKLTSINLDTSLAKFGEAFRNRDGEICYNCFCTKHNKELVLTEMQILEYYNEHKFCTGEKAKFMSMFREAYDSQNLKGRDKEVLDGSLRK